MKIIFVLIGLLLGFSIVDDLKAVTRIPVEIPASKLTVGEVLAIAQKYLSNESADDAPVAVVAIEWCSLPPSRNFDSRIRSDGTIWPVLTIQAADKWSWFVTYIAHSDRKPNRSGQLSVIRVLDSGQVEMLNSIRP